MKVEYKYSGSEKVVKKGSRGLNVFGLMKIKSLASMLIRWGLEMNKEILMRKTKRRNV